MNIFTIGFAQKSAKQFFEVLEKNGIDCLIDIRLNNSSQLAGFTKGKDLEYFLGKICKIKYIHELKFAPTKDILDNYKNKKISWQEYEIKFNDLLEVRNCNLIFNKLVGNKYNNICLLCSEVEPNNCHRRLFANYLKKNNPSVNIIHL